MKVGDKVNISKEVFQCETRIKGIVSEISPAKNSVDGQERYIIRPAGCDWFGSLVICRNPNKAYNEFGFDIITDAAHTALSRVYIL